MIEKAFLQFLKCTSISGQKDQEERMKQLTESLFEKQALLERVSSEKTALLLKMESMKVRIIDVIRSKSDESYLDFVSGKNLWPLCPAIFWPLSVEKVPIFIFEV